MVPLHLLTCYSDISESDVKSTGSRYSYATYSNGQAHQKNIAQMANDVRLLPYSAQFIMRSVPSLQGSVILLGLTVRQCSDKMSL